MHLGICNRNVNLSDMDEITQPPNLINMLKSSTKNVWFSFLPVAMKSQSLKFYEITLNFIIKCKTKTKSMNTRTMYVVRSSRQEYHTSKKWCVIVVRPCIIKRHIVHRKH